MHISAKIIRLAFFGGALGSLLRFNMSIFLGDLFSLLLVNLLGAALLGWLNGDKALDKPEFNAMWKTGFAGGFTTMSGVASMLVLGAQFTGWAVFAIGFVFLGLGVLSYWLSFQQSRKTVR
jgi:fluoride ion exporter CrcB/FEX